MTLTEIENLSFADLKAKKAELVAEAAKAKPEELAARYVQARTDAKHRDERMQEQAQTLAALQAGTEALTREKTKLESELAASKAFVAKREAECRAVEADLDTCQARSAAALGKLQAESSAALAKLQADLSQETARANAATALAKARRTALADVLKVVSPVLADEG